MRFTCPRCRFEERDETGLTPVAVCCPGCGVRFAPVRDRWVPAAERAKRRVTVLPSAETTIWLPRPARA